jgi:hypothetical protein
MVVVVVVEWGKIRYGSSVIIRIAGMSGSVVAA